MSEIGGTVGVSGGIVVVVVVVVGILHHHAEVLHRLVVWIGIVLENSKSLLRFRVIYFDV
jgi:hypothetical protein